MKSEFDDEDSQPSWLDTENDSSHRKEVEPLLFGTGKLSLKDPSEDGSAANTNFGFAGGGHQNEREQDGLSEDAMTVDSNKTTKSAKSRRTVGRANNKTKNYGSTNNDSFWTIPTPVTMNAFNNINNNNGGGSYSNGDSVADDTGDYSTVITFNEHSGRPDRPIRDWPVKIFFAIQAFALLTCFTLFVSQLLPLIFVPLSGFDNAYLALKIYLCIFAILFTILEIDHPSLPFDNAAFLITYAPR